MKGMMAKFSCKPRELKMACENEPWSHKARIVGFSVLMGSIANYYQYYFNMLGYRSGQFQAAALAGEKAFRDYTPNGKYSAANWTAQQTLDAWKDKSLKELKQINQNWKTGSY
jgi:UDP-galactopyranose mutase